MASRRFRPEAERVENRVMLSHVHALASAGEVELRGLLRTPPGYQAVRPNTPVLPFGAPLATATFIDPYAHIFHGGHTVIGQKTYVGPYSTLDATTGFIKIGSGSAVLDNAVVVSDPDRQGNPPSVRIGDSVLIGYGAQVFGPSVIGAYGRSARPTGVGPNAQVVGATIDPGSVVGALARVGPGVTVPPGFYVLPGANVTTDAEASRPALGKVVPLPANVLADLTTALTRSGQLAAGYTNLYQGNSATGANPGVDPAVTPGINNGNLAAVSGASQEPGPTSATAATGITFEPSRTGPKFPGPFVPQVEGDIPGFKARVTGDVRFGSRVHTVARHFGRSNSVRGDQGQPIAFVSSPTTGRGVTINSPLGGTTTTGTTTRTVGGIVVGSNFRADSGAVILGGPDAAYSFGDNVSIGQGAVVDRSTLLPGVTVGARSFVSRSVLPVGAVVPPGTILINNRVVGHVEW